MGVTQSLGTFIGVDHVLEAASRAQTVVDDAKKSITRLNVFSQIALRAARECFELRLEKVLANPARQVAQKQAKIHKCTAWGERFGPAWTRIDDRQQLDLTPASVELAGHLVGEQARERVPGQADRALRLKGHRGSLAIPAHHCPRWSGGRWSSPGRSCDMA